MHSIIPQDTKYKIQHPFPSSPEYAKLRQIRRCFHTSRSLNMNSSTYSNSRLSLAKCTLKIDLPSYMKPPIYLPRKSPLFVIKRQTSEFQVSTDAPIRQQHPLAFQAGVFGVRRSMYAYIWHTSQSTDIVGERRRPRLERTLSQKTRVSF